MKTATLPALRVEPSLREAAERVLRPDETLSRLMEASLENYIAHRMAEDDFIARGLRSAGKARDEQRYVTAEAVMAKLDKKLVAAKLKHSAKSKVSPGAKVAGANTPHKPVKPAASRRA